jgi:hypothetical protein
LSYSCANSWTIEGMGQEHRRKGEVFEVRNGMEDITAHLTITPVNHNRLVM